MYYRKLNSNLKRKKTQNYYNSWSAGYGLLCLLAYGWKPVNGRLRKRACVIILLKCNESPPVCTVLYKIFHLLPTVCGYRYQYHGIITNTVTQQDLDLFVLRFCDKCDCMWSIFKFKK